MAKALYRVVINCTVSRIDISYNRDEKYSYIVKAKNESQALRIGYRQTIKRAIYYRDNVYISDFGFVVAERLNIDTIKLCIQRDGNYWF